MTKRKVGVLIYTDTIRSREVKLNFFDAKIYAGIRCIIDDLDKNENELHYISYKQIPEMDVVLVTIISAYDIVNLINELRQVDKGNAKIIVGGAALHNIHPLKKYIDIAGIGRCEGQINDVLNGVRFPNFWRKEDDPNAEGKYEIGVMRKRLNVFGYLESSNGCRTKCSFCNFGWWHKYLTQDMLPKTDCVGKERNKIYVDEGYASSWDEREDFFPTFSWERRRCITALDGADEVSRWGVRKPFTKEQVIKKLQELAYTPLWEDGKYNFLKVYQLVGHPWDKLDAVRFSEVVDACRIADESMPKHNIAYLLLKVSHFIPMPCTPMQYEAVNLTDFKAEASKHASRLYNGRSFMLILGWDFPSPSYAVESVCVNRVWDEKFIERVMISPQYRRLKSWQKLKIMKAEQFRDIVRVYEIGEPMPTDNIIAPYNYKQVAFAFRKRRDLIMSGSIPENIEYRGPWRMFVYGHGVMRFKNMAERDDFIRTKNIVLVTDTGHPAKDTYVEEDYEKDFEYVENTSSE